MRGKNQPTQEPQPRTEEVVALNRVNISLSPVAAAAVLSSISVSFFSMKRRSLCILGFRSSNSANESTVSKGVLRRRKKTANFCQRAVAEGGNKHTHTRYSHALAHSTEPYTIWQMHNMADAPSYPVHRGARGPSIRLPPHGFRTREGGQWGRVHVKITRGEGKQEYAEMTADTKQQPPPPACVVIHPA